MGEKLWAYAAARLIFIRLVIRKPSRLAVWLCVHGFLLRWLIFIMPFRSGSAVLWTPIMI